MPATFRFRVIFFQFVIKKYVDLNKGKNNFPNCSESVWNFVCFITDKNRVRELKIRELTKRL
jgi:hypothetical protein